MTEIPEPGQERPDRPDQAERRESASPVDREFIAWNETMAARHDIDAYYADSHPLVRWIEERRLRALVSLASVGPGEHVLEVGCGAGHVLERFAGVRRTGVDLSEHMLERARLRLGRNVPLVRATADVLPFPDAAFKTVVCTELLEHVPDPAAVIRELMRVAGPSGRVVVSVPNEGNIDRAKRVAARIPGLMRIVATLAEEDNEWHLHRMDRRMLEEITEGTARIAQLKRIPAPILPLRYVALLRAL